LVTDGSETTTHRTRVFVADGHASYRDGMARLLEGHPAVDVVGEAADGTAALAGILRLQPDVALLDVGMAGLSGLEVCRRLRAIGAARRTRVVLITGTPDRDVTAAAADAGAIALLAKETPPGRRVTNGGFRLPTRYRARAWRARACSRGSSPPASGMSCSWLRTACPRPTSRAPSS
jgi:DNA-binding NarL/FixJ family response regulator